MRFNKIVSAIILLTVSQVGLANGECPNKVKVPNASCGWDVGVEALYLKPSYSADDRYFPYPHSKVINGVRYFNEQKFDSNWGYKLQGSYHFNTGNDFNINWYHWQESNTLSFTRPFGNGNTTGIIENDHIKFNWDAVNLEFGQRVLFGRWTVVRFHGGVQFVDLREKDFDPYILVNSPTDVVTDTDRFKFKFKGFGPRVGADMSHYIGCHFAVYSNVAAALLEGKNKINDTSGVEPNRASHRTIVPLLEIKLGAKYDYAVGNGVVSVNGGYAWLNYFNTFHLAQTQVAGQTDFGLRGPFLGINWVGNV